MDVVVVVADVTADDEVVEATPAVVALDEVVSLVEEEFEGEVPFFWGIGVFVVALLSLDARSLEPSEELVTRELFVPVK